MRDYKTYYYESNIINEIFPDSILNKDIEYSYKYYVDIDPYQEIFLKINVYLIPGTLVKYAEYIITMKRKQSFFQVYIGLMEISVMC